jgi:hypothetical protein
MDVLGSVGNYHPYVDQVKFTAYIYRHVDWFCSSAPKMNRDNWRLIRDSRLNFTINRANAEQTKDNSALGLTMSAVARRLDWLPRCH